MRDDVSYRLLVGHAHCAADGEWLLGELQVAERGLCAAGAARQRARRPRRTGHAGRRPAGIRGTPRAMKLETLAIHAGRAIDPTTGAVREPLHLSTTFERSADGSYPLGYSYARSGNPNRTSLERAVAALERGKDAVAFASGSQATLAAFSLAAPGGRIVCSCRLLPRHGEAAARDRAALGRRRGVRRHHAARPGGAGAVGQHQPALVRDTVEPAAARDRHRGAGRAGARAAARGSAVDNTFASPVLQQPLALGADLVMHSTTKYLGGHSDVLGGILVAREDGRELAALRDYQGTAGGVPSPFDCWLVLRSLATLPLRVRAQSASALQVAAVPARRSARRARALRRAAGSPGSRHRRAADVRRLWRRAVVRGARRPRARHGRGGATRLFTRATSLGGVESLIEHRQSVEGPQSQTPAGLLRRVDRARARRRPDRGPGAGAGLKRVRTFDTRIIRPGSQPRCGVANRLNRSDTDSVARSVNSPASKYEPWQAAHSSYQMCVCFASVVRSILPPQRGQR